MKSCYVAGGSSELDLVESYIDRLRAAGVPITHDWTKVVREHGGNPREATHAQRKAWALADLQQGIARANMVWLIMPATPSFGAGFELSAATQARVYGYPRTVVSGDTTSSIFTALADHEFATHAEALAFVIGEAKR